MSKETMLKVFKHPSLLKLWLDNHNIIKMDDYKYLQLCFLLRFDYKPDFRNPQTFNEWIQWTKLYYRHPKYPLLMDKIAVRDIIKEKIGEEYLVPLIGTYENFDDIDFDKLPNQFVIKCNHDSGSFVICRNKKNFNIEKAKRKINKHLKTPFWKHGREWGYKDIKPRIVIEKYLVDNNGNTPADYKFYCFNGKASYVMICTDRDEGKKPKFYYYNMNWELNRDFSNDGRNAPENFCLPKPKNFDKMIEIAEKLAQELPFVRLDLYSVNDNIYFGEYTTYPSAGFDNTRTKAAEEYLSKEFSKLKLKPFSKERNEHE